MPYEAHEYCLQPPDENASVWRFVSLPKFMDMVLKRVLHLSRLDLAEDPYDGRPIGELHDGLTKAMGSDFTKFVGDDSRLRTFISCWHLAEDEPASMWKLYASSDAGIAVRMPYRRLKEVLSGSSERLFLGRVQYGTRGFTGRAVAVPFDNAMWKSKSYEHEKEVRVLTYRWDRNGIPVEELKAGPRAVRIPMDLNVLDAEVIAAPATPDWIFDVVRSFCNNAGLTVPIRRSDLLTLRDEPFVPKPTGPRVPGVMPKVRPIDSDKA
jgi:hypothetical protein